MIALVSAPTNLGLRPPEPGGVPGTAKAPEALREAGLFRRMLAAGAVEAGTVLPGRYVDDDAVRPQYLARNEERIVAHARLLALRLTGILDGGRAPLVIGGDCSLLLGAGLALARSGGGLIHVDGHTDFAIRATAARARALRARTSQRPSDCTGLPSRTSVASARTSQPGGRCTSAAARTTRSWRRRAPSSAGS